MRIAKLLLICMCCCIAVPAVWGQAANSQAHQDILGYLDPHTGAFRPIAPLVEDAGVPPPALTTFTGTVNVTLTITIKTAALATGNVVCSMNVSVQDALTTGSPRFFQESDTVAATGTGSSRTCTLSVPYSWDLATQSSDKMSTGYTVSGSKSATVAIPNRVATAIGYDSRAVPSSGTTSISVNVTI